MSYKPYPVYKDSGVEWLGEIPEGWNVKRIGYHFSDRREKVSDKEYAALSVTMKGVVPQMEHVAKTEDNDNRKLVRAGDLVINSRSDRKGASGLSELDGSVSLINTVLVPDAFIFGLFAHYLIRSTAFQEEFYRYGKGIVADLWSTNFNEMKDIWFPLPSLLTQRAIAAFLDRETAKLDALVRDYEELVSLLREKRQALVSHAVTRGLSELVVPDDPEFGEWAQPVAFKDSGIEWLGEIPEGWDLKKLSFLFKAKKGSNAAQLTKEYCTSIEGEYPVYSGQTENDGVMAWINMAEFDSGSDGYLFSTTVGAKAMSLMHIRGKFSLSQNCMVIIPITNTTNVRFYYYHMQPLFSYERGLIPEHMQASFRMEDLYKYRLALPSISIQKAIAAFLDRETAKLDALVAEAEGAIELLKERRSALITAAVTGKINVEEIASTQI